MRIKILDNMIFIDEKFIYNSKEEIRRQLMEYLKGNRKKFNLSINFEGMKFSSILKAICEIPYGTTKYYGEIGREIGIKARIVGFACKYNPLPLIIPCHRVIGKKNLYFYKYGEEIKRFLMNLEEINLK